MVVLRGRLQRVCRHVLDERRVLGHRGRHHAPGRADDLPEPVANCNANPNGVTIPFATSGAEHGRPRRSQCSGCGGNRRVRARLECRRDRTLAEAPYYQNTVLGLGRRVRKRRSVPLRGQRRRRSSIGRHSGNWPAPRRPPLKRHCLDWPSRGTDHPSCVAQSQSVRALRRDYHCSNRREQAEVAAS